MTKVRIILIYLIVELAAQAHSDDDIRAPAVEFQNHLSKTSKGITDFTTHSVGATKLGVASVTGIVAMVQSAGLQSNDAISVGEETGAIGNSWGDSLALMQADGLSILSNGVMTVYDWNDGWGTLVERGFGIESPTGLLSTFDRDYQYEQNIEVPVYGLSEADLAGYTPTIVRGNTVALESNGVPIRLPTDTSYYEIERDNLSRGESSNLMSIINGNRTPKTDNARGTPSVIFSSDDLPRNVPISMRPRFGYEREEIDLTRSAPLPIGPGLFDHGIAERELIIGRNAVPGGATIAPDIFDHGIQESDLIIGRNSMSGLSTPGYRIEQIEVASDESLLVASGPSDYGIRGRDLIIEKNFMPGNVHASPGTYDHGTSERYVLPMGHSVIPLDGMSGMNIFRDSMINTDNDFENIDLPILGGLG